MHSSWTLKTFITSLFTIIALSAHVQPNTSILDFSNSKIVSAEMGYTSAPFYLHYPLSNELDKITYKNNLAPFLRLGFNYKLSLNTSTAIPCWMPIDGIVPWMLFTVIPSSPPFNPSIFLQTPGIFTTRILKWAPYSGKDPIIRILFIPGMLKEPWISLVWTPKMAV